VFYRNTCDLHRCIIWRDLRHVVVKVQVCVVEIGIKLMQGRLRLTIYIKGREIVVWRSNFASSRPDDSNVGRLLLRGNQMTRTSMWQRSVGNLPRLIEATVGAKMRIDGEWRAWIVRQISIIVRNCREQLEVVMVIST
jgi:hypothetical protein